MQLAYVYPETYQEWNLKNPIGLLKQLFKAMCMYRTVIIAMQLLGVLLKSLQFILVVC